MYKYSTNKNLRPGQHQLQVAESLETDKRSPPFLCSRRLEIVVNAVP